MVPALPGRYHRSELAPQRARSGAVDRIGRLSPGEVFALDTDHNIVTRWTGHSAVGGVRRPFVEAEAISGAASTT